MRSILNHINLVLLYSVISISIFLSFKFGWWNNIYFNKIDFLLISSCLLYFFIKDKIILVFFTFFLLIILNLFGILPIVSIIFLIFLSYLIGFTFQKILKIKDKKIFSINSFALGLGTISLIINVCSFFKINTSVFFFILFGSIGILIFLINFSEIIYFIKNNKIRYKSPNHGFILTNVFIFLSIYILINALIPDSSHDGLSTHLTIPKLLKLHQYWQYDVQNYIWSVQPFGSQWIYSFLYFFGGEVSIKIFLAVLLFLLLFYSYDFFIKENFNQKLAFASSLLIISLPLSLTFIEKLHIDIVHAFITTAIFFEIFKKQRNWYIISILTGICFSIKSSSILLIPLLVHIYFFDSKKNLKFKDLILILNLGLLFCFIPYFVAFIKTGSPTFPLYNEIFRSDLISKEAFYKPMFSNQSISDFFYTTFESKRYADHQKFNGSMGIVYFVLSITSLFYLNKSEKFKILILFHLIASIVIMFFFQTILRYVYFILPSLLIILILINFKIYKNSKYFLYALLILLIINTAKFDKVSNKTRINDYNIFLSKQKLTNYDLKKQPLKKLANVLNLESEYKNKKIFILTKNHTPKYYFFDMNVAFWSWHSLKIYLTIIYSGNLNDALKKEEFDYVIYSEDYNNEDLSYVFNDHPKDIGTFYDKVDKFFINKI